MTQIIHAARRFMHAAQQAGEPAGQHTVQFPVGPGCRSGIGAEIWDIVCFQALKVAASEEGLSGLMVQTVLSHDGFPRALAGLLARKLGDRASLPAEALEEIMGVAVADDADLAASGVEDIKAIMARDPAVDSYLSAFLYYKGFHALQSHRIAHWLWTRERRDIARFLQNRASEVFAVDIHPAVPIGRGVFIDHATGLVIGETAVVGNDVSILQGVTLGGTGKQSGDRHPKVRDGVLLSAGAKVLGNIEIGARAKVGAGSVVLKDVPPCATVAGVPARVVGWCRDASVPGLSMDQSLPDPEYFI